MAGAFSLSPELHRCQRIASLEARWHPCWWHLRIACRKNTVSVHKQCDLTAFSSDALLNVFTSVSCFRPRRSEAVLVCQKVGPSCSRRQVDSLLAERFFCQIHAALGLIVSPERSESSLLGCLAKKWLFFKSSLTAKQCYFHENS